MSTLDDAIDGRVALGLDIARRAEYRELCAAARAELAAIRAENAEAYRIATEAAPDLEGQPDRTTLVRRVAALAARYGHERDANAILRARVAELEADLHDLRHAVWHAIDNCGECQDGSARLDANDYADLCKLVPEDHPTRPENTP